jgi:hypothetical protein
MVEVGGEMSTICGGVRSAVPASQVTGTEGKLSVLSAVTAVTV